MQKTKIFQIMLWTFVWNKNAEMLIWLNFGGQDVILEHFNTYQTLSRIYLNTVCC